MRDSSRIVGELIEASTSQFTAQCARLHDPPAFGSFVRVGQMAMPAPADEDPFETAIVLPEGSVYGLVFEARTASLEPNRRPAAFGLDEEDLRREQPQIYELLATDFRCLIVGHTREGRLRHYLPDQPPRLHAMVAECTESEVCALTERFDYLRTIVGARDCACPDELVAASLRQACAVRAGDEQFLLRACKEVAVLLRDDFDRLTGVLRKLGPLPPDSQGTPIPR